jgi:hypothetical protein
LSCRSGVSFDGILETYAEKIQQGVRKKATESMDRVRAKTKGRAFDAKSIREDRDV